ncbi:hypothetical protein PVAP13_4NG014300 [Panicum virgatum]|uniref:Uncharacterized protein n=1 Tax=Panicum virgatum TaxID=38727 RepID=A0A8T0T3M2_PANVG|nr:hypothetical protein PVAP13_4NG014300 [Panicum virgatum]
MVSSSSDYRDDDDRSPFRWLPAARFVAACLMTVLVLVVLVKAITVVHRGEKLSLARPRRNAPSSRRGSASRRSRRSFSTSTFARATPTTAPAFATSTSPHTSSTRARRRRRPTPSATASSTSPSTGWICNRGKRGTPSPK